MYKFMLRRNYKNVYDIYKDGERIRDENDFCIKIDEENKGVAFFNAWTAHKLVNVDEIICELLELLKLIDTSDKGASNWEVIRGYNEYVINIALKKKLEKRS
jgi:hypothetical protein